MEEKEELLTNKMSELTTKFMFDVCKIANDFNVDRQQVFLITMKCLTDFYSEGYLERLILKNDK